MHRLAEHALKSAKDQFTKYFRLTPRYLKQGVKIILKLLFLTWRLVLRKKTKKHYQNKKNWKSLEFGSGCTARQRTHQNLQKNQFTNLCWLTSGAIREEVKAILKLPYLTQRWVLGKKLIALSNREQLQNCLKFDSRWWLVCRAHPKIW